MVCLVSCSLSAIFIIGMIYFYTMTTYSQVVQNYKASLPTSLQDRYDKIAKEREYISYVGYILGVIIAAIIILYNLFIKKEKFNSLSLACITIATTFITNYFYYTIHPKSDYMLDHITEKEQIKSWLLMYKEMQSNYHIGILLGIIAVGLFTFAFNF